MSQEEHIEKYLNGQLSPEEIQVFNERLETDPEFRSAVQFHKDLKAVTEAEDDLAFKEQLGRYAKSDPSKKSRRSLWYAAATIAILLSLGYFTLFNQSREEQLFSQHFEPYRNVVQPVLRGDENKDVVTAAFVAYENQEYETARGYFSKLRETSDATYASFYLAMCEMALDQPDRAIALLNESTKTSGELVEKVPWYLALAYLQSGATTEAQKALEAIVHRQNFNYQEASLLLQKLK